MTTVGLGPALAAAALAGGAGSGCSAATGASVWGAALTAATVGVLLTGVLAPGLPASSEAAFSSVVLATKSVASAPRISCLKGFFDADFCGAGAWTMTGAAGASCAGCTTGSGAMLRVVNTLVASLSARGPMRSGDDCKISRWAAKTSSANAASGRHGAPPERLPKDMATAVMRPQIPARPIAGPPRPGAAWPRHRPRPGQTWRANPAPPYPARGGHRHRTPAHKSPPRPAARC